MEDEVGIHVTLENHTTRLNAIESQVAELNSVSSNIQELTLSVNKLAINMEYMLEEQRDQGTRIKTLESEPAEKWNSAKKTAFTSIVSTIAGALAVGIIILIANYFVK